MNPAIYARVDDDGLVIAVVNALLLPSIVDQPGSVPAPSPDPFPEPGYAWRLVDGHWGQVPDLRGREYVDPSGTQKVAITHVLQQPPDGWALLPA
jgi:hypothetical protein